MKSLAADHWETAETRTLLGACLGAKGDYDGAELLLRDGYERLLDARGSSDVATHEARKALASLYRKWGKPEEAKSLELSARTGGADD